jgi:hypothetical protein
VTLTYTGNPGTVNGNPEFGPDGGTLYVSGAVDDSGAPTDTYLSCSLSEPSGTDYLFGNGGLTCSFSNLAITIPAATYTTSHEITLTATATNYTTYPPDSDTRTKSITVDQVVPTG